MAYLLIVLLDGVALFGHGALWVTLINRLNSYAVSHRILRWLNRLALLLCIGLAVWIVIWFVLTDLTAVTEERGGFFASVLYYFPAYIGASWVMAAWTSAVWLIRWLSDGRRVGIRSEKSKLLDLQKQTGEDLAGNRTIAWISRFPGNQIFQLEVRELELEVPGLPAKLDGFSIVHLSDLHLAGHVRQPFYDEAVRQVNELAGDIVVIAGDILDRSKCLPWLEPTLGKLTARYGVFFVLGNHEHRGCPPEEIRQRLTGCGLIDLGGTHHLLSLEGGQVLLVGNESPWELPPTPVEQLPIAPDSAAALTIVLSHAPDQITWAAHHGFDLLLAGHTHGGQFRLPLFGPLLAPSRFGVRYAGGTFRRGSTLMHVSRGLCGMRPARFNCRPELTKLILRKASEDTAAGA